ncbi:DNA-directed RNA polymerase III subunit RPC5-like [Branchiostoma lanceolatum]|uniref:DNA-directed RNA polymerase III subunit RPC5-like n=1 Tax=Branchiostoma lanceolatum TaxID=7740 RepID=UPI0034543EA6
MAEDDDPVVDEVDVFLAKGLAENLYLFQYPLRPSGVIHDPSKVQAARFKPQHQKVELEVGIDTQSRQYAWSKGEQIALNVDGKGQEASHFGSDVMDKQVLTSTTVPTPSSCYAVGMVRDGELHLTPVHGTVQMRPSYNYLDKADVRMKEAAAAMAADAGESSQDEEEDNPRAVTVRFARPETDETKARRMASYQYIEQQVAEEQWINCSLHGTKGPYAEKERQLLYTRATDFDASHLTRPPKEYLSMLLPEASEDSSEKPAMPSNVLSLSQLKNLSLGDQVKALMTNAKMMSFSQLLALLTSGVDPTAVLRTVQQVAMLVQGNWVVKSDILYPKDTCSPHSGAPAELVCRGRDYVMWRFTQFRFIVRKEATSIIKLPHEDVKEIFEQLAVVRVNKGWEFLLPHDQDFMDRYPDVVQRQQMLWDAKYSQLSKLLKLAKGDTPKKGKEPSHPGQERESVVVSGQERVKVARQRARSRSQQQIDPSSTAAQNSTTLSESAIVKTEPVDQGEPMDISSGVDNHLGNGVLTLPKGASALAANTSDNSGKPSDELRTEVVRFCDEKLRSNMVLSMSEMKRLLLLRLSQCPPGDVLGTGVSDKLLEQSMFEAGAMQIQLPWPPNSDATPDQQKVFALAHVGDKYDKIRETILEMFNESFKLRRNAINSKVQEAIGQEANKHDIEKVLREVCMVKGTQWYLKGSLTS